MINMFNIFIPASLLFIGAVEVVLLGVTVAAALLLHAFLSGGAVVDVLSSFQWQALAYESALLSCLYIMGCYDRTFLRRPRFALLRMTASLGLAAITLMLTTQAFPQAQMPGEAQVICMALSLLVLHLSREVLRRLADLPFWKSRVVVLGTNEQAQQVQALERASGDAGFVCLGFIPTGEGPAHDGQDNAPFDRIIRTKDLPSTVKRLKADEIVLAGDARTDTRLRDLLLQARLEGLRVTDVHALLERELGQVDISDSYPEWLLYCNATCKSRLSRWAKQFFDVAASLALLVLTAPLMLLTVIAIWLEDRGPILYRQERVGLNGTTFHVLKFRSMRVDAEKDGVARWAALKDPRVTLVGSFIRKVRIDELPQVINVLRGEMSFVGPRPERPSIVADLCNEIRTYPYRHIVKPGITGWAQVSYPYGASVEDAKQKLKYDLYYVKNQNLFLDIIIMLQTIRVIIWPEGAR